VTATMLITYRMRGIWLAKAWVRVCSALAIVVGEPRAIRWAVAGMYRVVRPQIIKQEWAK